jgi:hypothetical protein
MNRRRPLHRGAVPGPMPPWRYYSRPCKGVADGRACRLAGARVGAEERQAFELKMREADAMHAG